MKRLEWKPFMEVSESQESNFWEEGSRRNFQSLLMLTTVMVRWNQEFRWSKFNGNVRSKWNDQIKILVEGPEEKISSKFLKLENLIFENGVVVSSGLDGPGLTSRNFWLLLRSTSLESMVRGRCLANRWEEVFGLYGCEEFYSRFKNERHRLLTRTWSQIRVQLFVQEKPDWDLITSFWHER